ncbi:thioredoxin family protein [Flavobacterium sp. ALD4]|uniref:thioredoxin family protein n=1 Tax=Flavobacterium sp. ALD4 TaxID=2058314 RepID=UPI000C333B42|nr:thioredoxin family protein [Flavobacterium sp. ALD4]PKH66529.1 thioredoxin family protein [Flavobacterium sp. ALD4]
MKKSIAKALFKSHSYSEYRKLVVDLLKEEKSTGSEQSSALTNYSLLNETRMDRLEKTLKIPQEYAQSLKSLKNEYIWMVISEGWSTDAAELLPVFDKMVSEADGKIDIKIVLRDENKELMNLFLTNKAKSIPKLIVINKETGGALAHWGPRPKGAADLIDNYKKEHGTLDETAKTDLQLWFFHDKGLSTQSEVIDMMLDLDKEEE